MQRGELVEWQTCRECDTTLPPFRVLAGNDLCSDCIASKFGVEGVPVEATESDQEKNQNQE
jgi:hypothetical protein